MRTINLLCVALLGLVLLLSSNGQAQSVFFIEAEDFDYGRGQHPPETDAMPYYGAAYFNYFDTVAERGIDFDRSDFLHFIEDYRYGEFPNVPILGVPLFPDGVGSWMRGDLMLIQNYKLGYLSEGGESWFNYTRDFPAGRYYVYAGLSYGDSTAGAMRGALWLVTSGVGTASQRTQDLGKFRGDGSGSWNRFVLVPLMKDGLRVTVDLAGLTTLRFTTGGGDFDYLVFRPEGLPEAFVTPGVTETANGSTVILNANPAGNGPFTLQWRKDGQDIPGATDSTLTLSSVTDADAGFYTVVVKNALGSWISTPATVKVYCPLQIPVEVNADQPCPGAGIYLPAPQLWPREQHYRFQGTAGQVLYFESLGADDTGWGQLQIRIASPRGTVLFSTVFGYPWDVLPSGTVLLPETGDYNVTIYVPPNEFGGRYAFRLGNPGLIQRFPIAVGDSIPESHPGPGAGILETTDNVDVFELTVDAPVDVYFSDRYSIGQRFLPLWALLDPDGELVFLWPRGFDSGYSSPRSHALTKLGVYRLLLISGVPAGESQSSYAFQLLPTTIQQFKFDLGDRISPDQPAPGAGRLDGIGSLDSYTFKGKAGQAVYIHELPDLTQRLGAVYQVASPSGRTVRFDFIDDALSWQLGSGLVTLPETGLYRLNVWPLPDIGSPDSIGTYSVELLPSAGIQQFLIEPGETVDQNFRGKWTKGAGYLDPNGAEDIFTFQLKADSVVTLVDLGSDGNRIEATFGVVLWGWGVTEPMFTDVLDGVNASSVSLSAGVYEVRVSAPGGDPTVFGRYSFMVKLN